ncbi:MAG: hypothetical protein K5639_02385 [Eubacterium sp.]|nr:hypothetical protein [Eubacterium sp.]
MSKLNDNKISKPVLYGLVGGGVFLLVALIVLLIVFFVTKNKTEIKMAETIATSGIGKVTSIDPFEEVKIDYKGISPNLTASVNNQATAEPLSLIYFSISKTKGIKAGDKITVKVESPDEDTLVKKYGVRFSQTEKEFTVENVDAYVTSPEELDDAGLSTMKDATKECVEEYFDDATRRKKLKINDVRYFGYYFEVAKNPKKFVEQNKIYMVYSALVKSKKKKFKEKTVYFPVEFKNVKKLKEGGWDINTDYTFILGSTSLKYGYYETVDGYTSLNKMHEELVQVNAKNYTAVGVDGLAG